MRNAFVNELIDIAAEDPSVMLITADLGFGVFEKFQERFPSQFLNVGVAEQNMVGVATGLALEGRKVVVYSIANFVTLRCLEQIRNDACYHGVNITIVCSGGGFTYGALGMSHHATEDLSIMRALPGITLVAPCDAWEAGAATRALVYHDGVGYLRLEKSSKVFDSLGRGCFQIGRSRLIREGADLTLMATGGVVEEAVEAANRLEHKGIYCSVLSMHSLKPLDDEAIKRAVEKTAGIITIEENNVLGGLGGAVAESLMRQGAYPGFLKSLGLQDQYTSVVGSQEYLRQKYEIDASAIAECCQQLVQKDYREVVSGA